MKKTAIISLNWETGEILASIIEGDECDIKAEALKKSIENDEWGDNWEFFIYKNKEAIEAILERWLGVKKK